VNGALQASHLHAHRPGKGLQPPQVHVETVAVQSVHATCPVGQAVSEVKNEHPLVKSQQPPIITQAIPQPPVPPDPPPHRPPKHVCPEAVQSVQPTPPAPHDRLDVPVSHVPAVQQPAQLAALQPALPLELLVELLPEPLLVPLPEPLLEPLLAPLLPPSVLPPLLPLVPPLPALPLLALPLVLPPLVLLPLVLPPLVLPPLVLPPLVLALFPLLVDDPVLLVPLEEPLPPELPLALDPRASPHAAASHAEGPASARSRVTSSGAPLAHAHATNGNRSATVVGPRRFGLAVSHGRSAPTELRPGGLRGTSRVDASIVRSRREDERKPEGTPTIQPPLREQHPPGQQTATGSNRCCVPRRDLKRLLTAADF
jgi:hypothetical protein